VEISIQLGVADAIADVVGSGRTLRLHDLVAFGDSLCDSEAVLIERAEPDQDGAAARDQLVGRVQGVVFGQQYLMLDYDCPRTVLDAATEVTPDSSRHHRPAGRSGLGCGAGPGTPQGRQLDHGRARGDRREGDPGIRHQVLSLLTGSGANFLP